VIERCRPGARRLLVPLLLTLTLAVLAISGEDRIPAATAQAPPLWTPIGPVTGATVRFFSVAVAPSNPNIVYAGSDLGIHRSTDGGATWTTPALDPSGNRIVAYSLAVDAVNPSLVYAGSGQGVHRSTDGGATWSGPAPGSAPSPVYDAVVHAIATVPGTTGVAYATPDRRLVVKTTDSGASWQPVITGFPAVGLSVFSLAVDPSAAGTVYAGLDCCSSERVYKTVNGGERWFVASTGYSIGVYPAGFAIDPTTPATVYAASLDRIYRSTDGAGAWSQLATVAPGIRARALTMDRASSTTLYVASDQGLYRSTNGGLNWTRILTGAANAVLANGALVLAATEDGSGLRRSTDGGATWTTTILGRLPADPKALDTGGGSPSALWAATGTGIFRTTDAGSSWTGGFQVGSDYVTAVAAHPTDPARAIIALSNYGMHLTQDGGASWMPVYTDSTRGSITSVAYAPSSLQTVYAGSRSVGMTTPGSIFKSTNGGMTWTDVGITLPFLSVTAVAADPASEDTVYAGTTTGILKTTNGGMSWSNAGPGTVNVRALAADPLTPGTVYAVTTTGLLKTTTGGASWGGVGSGLPADSLLALAVDPLTTTTLYAGSWGGGVYRSTNGGSSWTQINAGLPVPYVVALAVDRANPTRVYAGVWASGVYRLDTGAASPSPSPSGSPAPSTSPSASPSATPTPTPIPGGAALRVMPADTRITPNGAGTVRVEAVVPAAGLGAWSIDLTYNPAVVTAQSCTTNPPNGSSVCNTNPIGAPNTVRLAGSSVTGVTGTATLASIVFQAAGTAGASGPLTLTAAVFADPNGAPIPVTVTNGTVMIGATGPDANGDGVVNSVDALCILRQTAGFPATAACPNPLPQGDVNNDLVVNSIDSLCVLRYVAGLPRTPACPLDPPGSPAGRR
jgi:photosystem II stability/assembly factor-like uncharacterized protein